MKFFSKAIAALSLMGTGCDAVMQFFGEDINLGNENVPISHPNSDIARHAFIEQLCRPSTEDFESFSDNADPPLHINFPGVTTATITGDGEVNNDTGAGRYPISGHNWYDVRGNFKVNFATPVAGVGFYGVDIGDFNGQVTVETMHGNTMTYTVPNSMDIGGGGVLYYGIIDEDDPFTSLTVSNTGSGTDKFAFDDFTVGEVCGGTCPIEYRDNFDSGFNPSSSDLWDSSHGAATSKRCGFVSPRKALFFNGDSKREVVSEDIFGGPAWKLSFKLLIGSDTSSHAICEDADANAGGGEDVFLDFKINGSWVQYARYDTEDYNDFTCVEVSVPEDATRFRLRQPEFTGKGYDNWAVDNVKVRRCPFCGDGEVDPGEQCDDGNDNEYDGCLSNCKIDTDEDGVPDDEDICEGYDDTIDTDGDGIPNGCDNCPYFANADQTNSDDDSHGDACDNCPHVDNEDQLNSDYDSHGDACDNCPNDNNEDQLNSDYDSHGDACDNCPNDDNENQADSDYDHVGDVCDNCPHDYNPDQEDVDGDGIGDVCDRCCLDGYQYTNGYTVGPHPGGPGIGYQAADGCSAFVACYPLDVAPLANLGYQSCPGNLLWNGTHCDYPSKVDCDDWCFHDPDWMQPMPMGCCSDGMNGNQIIDDCLGYAACWGGTQSGVILCGEGFVFVENEWGGSCVPKPEDFICNAAVTCTPMIGGDRRLFKGDHKLRGRHSHP